MTRFSEEGANVIVNGGRADTLNESIAALPAARTLAHPGDASDPAVCAALMQAAVERFGGLHVLVNNAAVIAFLASDDARFVTGVNLPANGGLPASNGQPHS